MVYGEGPGVYNLCTLGTVDGGSGTAEGVIGFGLAYIPLPRRPALPEAEGAADGGLIELCEGVGVGGPRGMNPAGN